MKKAATQYKSAKPVNSARQHRVWRQVCGSQDDCLRTAQEALSGVANVLWISTSPLIPSAIPAKKAKTVLGQEFVAVVFDAFSGLDVNALAAVSGTLVGGGTLWLLSPEPEVWPQYPDPDYRRFLPYPYLPEQVRGRFLERLVGMLNFTPHPQPFPRKGGRERYTQTNAVHAIVQADTPIVLSADRGRGKSAALGMASSHLIAAGQQVLLTAPARAAVESVFRHAEHAPVFIAPDDLLQTLPYADVLLVDEAAAIPVPLLLKMLKHYPRCVFSTTLHGYEGSGRGFVLRFQKQLDIYAPGWQAIRLHQPMRWAENDPLEHFINHALLLDVEVTSFSPDTKSVDVGESPQYQYLNRDELAANEPLLRQVFGLLVTAHYQTRPSDLRQMLDAPDISIHVLVQEGQTLAVALLSREGGLDAELTAAIHAGKRRPHGHPVPQTLTFHAGIAGAAQLLCERIMRIAVHPDEQGRGLGRQLVSHLVKYAEKSAADYIGVSYAMSPELLRFWEQAGFALARIGHRRDTASGAKSAVQIRGLTAVGKALADQCVVQLTSPV